MNMEIDQEEKGTPSSSPHPPRSKKGTMKFKDFTLNHKRLFESFSEELQTNLLKSPCKFQTELPQQTESAFVTSAIAESQKSTTEAGGVSFSSSGDPRIDFFFQVMERSTEDNTKSLLAKSWTHHPTHTLKMIAALRDIREGKGVRRPYHDCLYWMYKNHPRTLYENLEQLLTFGYWKDALQFLLVILFKGYTHNHLAKDDVGGVGHSDRHKAKGHPALRWSRRGKERKIVKEEKEKIKGSNFPQLSEKESYNSKVCQHFGFDGRFVGNRFQREEMKKLRVRFARERFHGDGKYKLFHVKIAQIFAKQLFADWLELQKGGKNVSLAGKWAPSIEGHFDRYTLISSTVALELVKIIQETGVTGIQNVTVAKAVEELKGKPTPVSVYLSRKLYHKEFCVPLRKHLELPETAMSAGQWESVKYERVASKCMQRNSRIFEEKDGKRFEQFLKKPDSKVAGKTLKPIEILSRAMTISLKPAAEEERLERLLIEKQWNSLLEDVKGKGGGMLKSAVAVCNMGNEDGANLSAAMGLTLLTMSLSAEPWNTTCISFMEKPKFHEIPKNLSLVDKVACLQSCQYGSKVDLHAVFKLILSVGLKYRLSQEQMPRTLLIFTHMEFSQAFRTEKQTEDSAEFMKATNFEAAEKLFRENNYKLPTLIFWNLRKGEHSKWGSIPVRMNEMGAILLSGFSAQQLAYVCKQEDLNNCNSLQFVMDVVEKQKYNKLTVVD